MIFFARRFKQDVRELSKKYRHIRSDLQTTLEEISQGNLIGNQISGVGYPVFKVRIKNSDIDKGKSEGYRLIYYIQSPEVIIIITISPNLTRQIFLPGKSARLLQIIKLKGLPLFY